jgi:ribosomal protein L11 methyltransferase
MPKDVYFIILLSKFYYVHYFQLSISIANDETRELLIAALAENGIEGFEESDDAIKAFVAEADYQEDAIAAVLAQFGLSATIETIAPTNWNAQWEADFDPVVVADFCTIRAHFHQLPIQTRHDIVITPKMSFGTGHHATTRLMVEQMEHLSFTAKRVLDFGTGTGILAILAEQLGAAEVIAIDNDEWSFENAQENLQLNHCHAVQVSMDDIEQLDATQLFDIVLANINRHILLAYMANMYALLKGGATLLMSGLLVEDETIVTQAAMEAGFQVEKVVALNNWITILCRKP